MIPQRLNVVVLKLRSLGQDIVLSSSKDRKVATVLCVYSYFTILF
jgi:hypothetical protein